MKTKETDNRVVPLVKSDVIFRNYTNRHEFIVGDKISYQIGNYNNPGDKYRAQGFVLALGFNSKNEPMYYIGNMNTVIYDSKKDAYCSDKRTTPRWYTAKELHCDDDFKPKLIGYKSHSQIIRVLEGKAIHLIRLGKTVNKHKNKFFVSITTSSKEKQVYPKKNVFLAKFRDAFINEDGHYEIFSNKESVVATIRFPDNQFAKAKSLYESGDKTVIRVETFYCKGISQASGRYIKPTNIDYTFYQIVDIVKR